MWCLFMLVRRLPQCAGRRWLLQSLPSSIMHAHMNTVWCWCPLQRRLAFVGCIGQALLYESARLLHSRPHPLQGDFYTNFFIHFRPKHWEELMAAEDMDGMIAKKKRSWSAQKLEVKARELERLREGSV